MSIRNCILLLFFLALNASFATSIGNKPTDITIYWDTSLSMKDRDLNKEFELLNSYFDILQNLDVKLITFNNTIVIHKNHTIVNADWASLKSDLQESSYDGVAIYDILLQGYNSDVNLLFTDGIEVIDNLVVSTKTKTFIVNSSTIVNHKVLQKQSIISQANYLDLNIVTLEESLLLLKNEKYLTGHKKPDLKEKSTIVKLVDVFTLLTGNVSGADGPLEGAAITVNNELGTITDTYGNYQIRVKKDDTITVSYLGYTSKKILVNQSNNELNVFLAEDTSELKEVIVKGKVPLEDEFEDTGYGKVNKKKVGYAVQSIDDEEISELITDAGKAAQGQFSVSHNSEDLSRTVMRGITSIMLNSYPLIIIDGAPIRRTSSADKTFGSNFDGSFELRNFIDPNNIAKITILKGLAATNRYGSEGANGVFLITTKTASFVGKSKEKKITPANRNNFYKENLTLINATINAEYIDELKINKSLNTVYEAYLKQRTNYITDTQYFLNVSDYISQWGAKEIASSILSNILEINTNNVDLLRLVAYKAEQNYDFLLAKKIYERIVFLKPNEAQSHRDLALIYQETGNYERSLDIYNDILNGRINNVDFSGLNKNIQSELRRLISKHKKELTFSKIPIKYLNNVSQDARIVFDWNNKNALFELQFVNPQKLFFTWSHTKSKNAVRLNDERIQGFNSEEFLLIDAPKGDWLINIENKTKKGVKDPILIKYTVYYNYGKDNERKELKTILLNSIKGKQMIGKIII